MNDKQKKALWLGIAIMAAMGIYPPWNFQSSQASIPELIGYSWIFLPARTWTEANVIDVTRLTIQWIVVALITAGLLVSFKTSD